MSVDSCCCCQHNGHDIAIMDKTTTTAPVTLTSEGIQSLTATIVFPPDAITRSFNYDGTSTACGIPHVGTLSHCFKWVNRQTFWSRLTAARVDCTIEHQLLQSTSAGRPRRVGGLPDASLLRRRSLHVFRRKSFDNFNRFSTRVKNRLSSFCNSWWSDSLYFVAVCRRAAKRQLHVCIWTQYAFNFYVFSSADSLRLTCWQR